MEQDQREKIVHKLGGFVLWLVFFLFLASPAWANGCPPRADGCIPDDVSNIRLDCVIVCILADFANFLITISPAVIVIFLVIGGIKYMASAGDERKLESARRFITLVVLGSLAILGVATIFQIILKSFLGIG